MEIKVSKLKNHKYLPSRKVNLVLFAILLLIGYGGGCWGMTSGGFPLYLMLGIPLALIWMVIIGLQDNIKNSYFKATFSAYLSIFAVLLLFDLWAFFVCLFRWDFDVLGIAAYVQLAFWAYLPLIEDLNITILESEIAKFHFSTACWIIVVFLIGFIFWLFSRVGMKFIRILGKILVILIFTAVFYNYYFEILRDFMFAWAFSS